MEPLFINRYIRDEAVIREYHRAYYFDSIHLCLYAFVGISFIFNLVLLLTGHAAFDSLLFLAAAVVIFFFLYHRRIVIAIKRDKEQFGQPPLTVYEVSETGIRIGINDHFSEEVPFSQFRHVKETKHLILLPSRARLLYIFHKDGFVKGSVPEFNRFLYEKKIRFK